MSGVIDAVFGFCCFLITEIGLLFGLSYEAINVIAFCYVEPIFTGIMVVLAILAICKVPVKKLGTWFFWIVVGCVIALMIAGTVCLIRDCHVFGESKELLKAHLLTIKETSPYITCKYNDTISWLQNIAYKNGMSYELVNILLYVVGMPILCIVSYIIILKQKSSKS
jgi:energy-coupling factor transporter transmembrane protein EcfT